MHGIEIKHLRAAVALADERNFSRAALRLRIGQSGLTKQISALEAWLGFDLCIRESRTISLTPAGEVFVGEARLALQHLDRAIHLSRESVQKTEIALHIGKSPYTDPYLITKLLSVRQPLFPNVRVYFTTKLAPELTLDILSGALDAAFLTGVPYTASITGTVVIDQPFWVAMLEDDPLAMHREILGDILRMRSCILFERHVHPNLYDELVRVTQPASAPGCVLQHVMTAEDALQMVLRGSGVAVLTQPGAWRILKNGVTVRPLRAGDVRVRTQLCARSDNRDRALANLVQGMMKTLNQVGRIDQLQLRLSR